MKPVRAKTVITLETIKNTTIRSRRVRLKPLCERCEAEITDKTYSGFLLNENPAVEDLETIHDEINFDEEDQTFGG